MTFDNKPREKNEWLKDFAEYSALDEAMAPGVPTDLRARLKARLFPNPWIVFSKVAALHLITGTASLAICHQFGLNPFATRHSLADLYMRAFGHQACLFACGLTFVAGTYLLASFFLSLEEFEAIRRTHWLQTGALSIASLMAFWLFGADLASILALLWLAGAALGGVASFEGVYRMKQRLVAA
jgi:hypothetical protein